MYLSTASDPPRHADPTQAELEACITEALRIYTDAATVSPSPLDPVLSTDGGRDRLAFLALAALTTCRKQVFSQAAPDDLRELVGALDHIEKPAHFLLLLPALVRTTTHSHAAVASEAVRVLARAFTRHGLPLATRALALWQCAEREGAWEGVLVDETLVEHLRSWVPSAADRDQEPDASGAPAARFFEEVLRARALATDSVVLH